MYLVIVDTTLDNKIAKYKEYPTRAEADAHVTRVLSNYPDAFVIDNPAPYALSYTTVDVSAKKIYYDKAAYDSYTVMGNWDEHMQELSSAVNARSVEDIYDAMPLADRDRVNPITKNKIVAIKAHRAGRPV